MFIRIQKVLNYNVLYLCIYEYVYVCRYFIGRVDIYKLNLLIYIIDYNLILILIYEFDFLMREKFDCLY